MNKSLKNIKYSIIPPSFPLNTIACYLGTKILDMCKEKKYFNLILMVSILGYSGQAFSTWEQVWGKYGTKRNIAVTIGSVAALGYAAHKYLKVAPAQELVRVVDCTKNEDERSLTCFAIGTGSSPEAGKHRHVEHVPQKPGAFITSNLVVPVLSGAGNTRQTCFGQKDDVEKFERAIMEFGSDISQPLVLAGSSRGAATCLNYIGSNNYRKNQEKINLKAVVAESPFASIETLITSERKKSLFQWWFHDYCPWGYQPLTSAQTTPHDIPIFLFCSKDDEVVPVSQTIDYYKEMREHGHTKIHILIVDHGAHAKILNRKIEGPMVRNAIHAFYKKYGVPYNPEWAQEGQTIFDMCQPDAQVLEKIIQEPKTSTLTTLFKMSGNMSGSRT